MDNREIAVRLWELAAKTYGGPASVHSQPDGVAKIATDWYNGIINLEKPDTVTPSSTLKLPKK